MDLTIEHRARLNEAVRCCNDYALRSAVIRYLEENAWGDDCLFFLRVLDKMLTAEMVSTWGIGELCEDIHDHIN